MGEKSKIGLGEPRGQRLLGRLVREAVRPYFGALVLAVLSMALVAGMTAASAWLMDPVVNKVFIEREQSTLWLIGGAVAATFVLKSVASYFHEVLLSYVGLRIVSDMQQRLYRHLIGHDVAMIQSRHSGALISHFTYDINAMRGAVSSALISLGRDSLSVVFLVAVMVYQQWQLSLIALVATPLTLWPLQVLSRRMRRVSIKTQDEMAALTTRLSQSFQGIRVIKAFGMEIPESERMRGLVDRIYKLTFRAAGVRAASQPIIDVFGGLAIAAVIVYGGRQVIEGVTTAGAFFSFITAVMMAYQPIRALGKVAPTLQEGLAAAERVFALLDHAPAITDRPGAPALPRQAGEVRFEDVRFSYDGEKQALAAAAFAAPAGQVTALVGQSGAGKSTVFNLIPRFYDVDGGTVRINGRDVREVTLDSLRSAIAVVSQDVMLFDDSVMNNIRYGRPDATDQEVVEAARAAYADGFIRAMPQGYETVVGEFGMRLSGGQRQRLAIARAILKDAPILLLDEATSALDTESERAIQEALGRLMAGRTTLVIAHRLSTIRDATIIHVFEEGRVVESGDHDALIRRGGRYARLHALQFAPDGEAALQE